MGSALTRSRYRVRFGTIEKCDVIVIASPLTPEARGLFDAEGISRMKRGPYVVNIARGAIADTDAVVEALQGGQLGG